ncbi:TMEM165/GDT1 family protein [Mycobacterium montefiorense]|uniref:GDT1 family protein n=1 Tax=Mycobacterium montefiorense TaxID=154654 RepID=A0AA37PL49_9MYCO|nr:TMEM165/GDT1 family protein [Mycobacterium montefiorense]GBG40920.1 UPF0016 family membrane protein [Mycobacterium montefiorense]GKU33535.1 UPF0016 family membrane protein [Mycobacterium montefiorense]GKU40031.1 UPF0016 family membrane protein [Mycobacterium montefiorense]GKU45366.1 UPF0016 family membrane protein [Mycobacterium montefiorense]GKU49425.1 UPF0016 family membrane protein [Mycobacterium montefiorense]
MLAATLLSLPVLLPAELGDRSQLITMTYALCFRWWVVLPGVTLAAFLVHRVSVTIGDVLGATLPARPMALASAIAFLIFAAWAWREGAAADDEAVSPWLEPRLVLLTVVSSFALAEMSDKTTLAPAIGSGRPLHRRLPHQLLHVLASMLFVTIGLWMLLDSALGWRPVAIAVTAVAMLGAVTTAAAQTLRRRHTGVSQSGRSPEAV